MKTSGSEARVMTIGWRADAVLGALVVLIVAMMIVPLPTPLLDLLLALNLGVAALVLLGALYVRDALSLTALPTLLLLTTLYRLALNVSSTRLILLQADAGAIIRAFGDFVVRGDYLVGGVIFLILTLIQYVVIARGAERVAEVGARFCLDAMPGKQLAIDGDLRLGLMTPATALQRRRALERESQLYGAMDGAMKFVKGDAIAGIAISLINFVAGAAIGVSSRGLDWVSSLQTYGLLTVGDGLVSQIPALLISTAAAIVVTRVASEDDNASLAQDIGHQWIGRAPALWAAAVLLLVLGLLPGLPTLPFVLVAVGAVALARQAQRVSATSRPTPRAEVSRLALHVNDAPMERVHARWAEVEQHLQGQRGVALPPATIVQDATLGAGQFTLTLDGVPVARGEVGALVGLATALLDRAAAQLWSVESTQRMLESVAQTEPSLVRALVPAPLSLATLTQVLQQLLDEGLSVGPAPLILNTLATGAGRESDVGVLVAKVRVALQAQTSYALAPQGTIDVLRLDPLFEDTLRQAWRPVAHGGQLALAPSLADDIVNAARDATANQTRAVVLTTEATRQALHHLLRAELANVRVISARDLLPDVRVTVRAWIGPGSDAQT